MRSALLVSAVMLALSIQAPAAQSGIVVGQWRCQTSYTQFDQGGNRTSGYVQEFTMQVQPGGTLAIQGSQAGFGGVTQIQGQGSWTLEQGAFVGKATVRDNSPLLNIPIDMFVMGTLESSALRFSLTNDQKDPTGTYVAARYNSICERPSL